MPASTDKRDVSDQTAAPLALRKGNLHSLAVYLDVLGDDRDEFVLQGLQKLRRDLDPIVGQHQLQAFFGDIPTGRPALSE